MAQQTPFHTTCVIFTVETFLVKDQILFTNATVKPNLTLSNTLIKHIKTN